MISNNKNNRGASQHNSQTQMTSFKSVPIDTVLSDAIDSSLGTVSSPIPVTNFSSGGTNQFEGNLRFSP